MMDTIEWTTSIRENVVKIEEMNPTVTEMKLFARELNLHGLSGLRKGEVIQTLAGYFANLYQGVDEMESFKALIESAGNVIYTEIRRDVTSEIDKGMVKCSIKVGDKPFEDVTRAVATHGKMNYDKSSRRIIVRKLGKEAGASVVESLSKKIYPNDETGDVIQNVSFF